jgi:hypothetical protein
MYQAHPPADGGLCGHGPARPGWSHTSSPVPVRRPARVDWASSRPHLAVDALALLLAFGSANTWREDLHLARSVPRLAHTLAVSGAVYRVRSSGWLGGYSHLPPKVIKGFLQLSL